jgi:glucan biosynthesis protein C
MSDGRRHDIDFLRVIAFDLLILYHVGMFFVPWGWHVKNNQLSEGIIPLMIFLNQWRLPLLFVISGMGTRFALAKRSGRAYIGERTPRLLVPLAFCILVIIPPQVYFERLAQGITFNSFFDFYPHFFDGIYPSGNFSWHHLWFLPYLYFFSLIFAPVFLAIRRSKESWRETAGSFLKKYPLAIFLMAIPLIIVELAMRPYFPVTMAFWGDWYAMAKYPLLFFYGFLFISIKDYFFGQQSGCA